VTSTRDAREGGISDAIWSNQGPAKSTETSRHDSAAGGLLGALGRGGAIGPR
jgi:hypothetical protein